MSEALDEIKRRCEEAGLEFGEDEGDIDLVEFLAQKVLIASRKPLQV